MRPRLRAFVLAGLLALAGSAMAAEGALKAVSADAPPAPAVARPALKVTLKDGQEAELKLAGFDAHYLEAVNASGKAFSLPWAEVARVDSADAGAELDQMRARLSPEPVAVRSRMAPRDPGRAFTQALWPGFLLHGAGHRYAGANDTFLSLAGAELFGVVVGAFGLGELLGPEIQGENKNTAQALAIAGGSLFAVTWAWDLAFAPSATRRVNAQQGLVLAPTARGAVLSMRY